MDCLKKDDIGSSLRYPYTSAYLDMVGGDRPLNPSLGSVWNEFYPNRRDYWDLMHDSPEIHHRLDPTYLRNHYSNSR